MAMGESTRASRGGRVVFASARLLLKLFPLLLALSPAVALAQTPFRVVFQVQPANATAGVAIAPAVKVAVPEPFRVVFADGTSQFADDDAVQAQPVSVVTVTVTLSPAAATGLDGPATAN